MQAPVRRRFGLRRFPVATVVVFAVTATTSLSGAGLAGELAGYAWQPRGAGNSVAVCGLAGALIVALLAGTGVPRLAPTVVLWWCGALLPLHWGAVPLVVCVAGAAVVQLTPGWAAVTGQVVAVAAAGAAVALAAVRDIHGAAMLVDRLGGVGGVEGGGDQVAGLGGG